VRPDNAAPDQREVDNFDNCLRTLEPTPSYTSVGVDVLKSHHDASSKSAIAHVGANHMAPAAVLSGTFLVLGIQFGRLPRHQRVVEDTLETQNEQRGQTE